MSLAFGLQLEDSIAPRRQPPDINEVVAETLELARNEVINRPVAVVTSLASNLPHVSGDRIQLQQALLNLIVNACEAANGTLPNERSLALSTMADGEGSVMIAVATGAMGCRRRWRPGSSNRFTPRRPLG